MNMGIALRCRTFSRIRSTLSDILLRVSRTSVFCCRVSDKRTGTLLSDPPLEEVGGIADGDQKGFVKKGLHNNMKIN